MVGIDGNLTWCRRTGFASKGWGRINLLRRWHGGYLNMIRRMVEALSYVSTALGKPSTVRRL